MDIPKDAEILELKTSTIWFDKEDIMYSLPKMDAPQLPMEELKTEMDKLRAFTGGKKVCLIAESRPRSSLPSKKERDFIAEELNSLAKAMAIVITSPLSRMIANLFFGFKPPSYPVKMFKDITEAREWIRQYLK